MYRTVVVPVDGSPLAEHAVPWALAAAGPGAAVHLAHVHVPAAPVAVEGVVVADSALDANLRELDADYLAALAGRVRQAAPQARVSGLALDADDPLPTALAAAAAELAADLVVMTTHGRGPFARFLLGSVADDTARASAVPVLIVRGADGPAPDLAARPGANGVLVALDGSPWAAAILPPAARLAAAFGCGVTVLMVGDADGPADDYLAGAVRELAGLGVAATARAVRGGDPTAAITGHARANPGTVVALATHGRTGLSRLVHRRVAEAVVHAAADPVLVFRPGV